MAIERFRSMRPAVLGAGMGALLGAALMLLFLSVQCPSCTRARLGSSVRSTLLGEPFPIASAQFDPVAAGKAPVPCPPPEGAMVVLVIGQSHAANFVGERFVGGPQIFNAFDGRCYRADDPLLGADDVRGNLWTWVGQQAVAQGKAKSVVILLAAVGGTDIAQWRSGGNLHRLFRRATAGVPASLTVDQVAIQLGENDYAEGTSYQAYRDKLAAMIAELRAAGIRAPVHVAIESRFCSPDRPDDPIARAQRSIADPGQRIFAGPDMNRIAMGRYDGCHMSGAAARTYGARWMEVLFPGR